MSSNLARGLSPRARTHDRVAYSASLRYTERQPRDQTPQNTDKSSQPVHDVSGGSRLLVVIVAQSRREASSFQARR